MIAMADATKTLARMRDETEGRRFRKRFVNSVTNGVKLVKNHRFEIIEAAG